MVNFAVFKTDLGYIKIVEQNGAVEEISFINNPTEFGVANKTINATFKEIKEYLLGKRKIFTFKYNLKGTPFQVKVWHQLEKINYGETKTYKDIAVAVGCPKGCRAVGGAIHNNPIGIVIPCHRVIGKNGKLTGYAGGLDVKEKLLKIEKENTM